MNDEERDELDAVFKDGQKVNTTVNTPGWTDVICPRLKERQETLVKEFLNATTFEDFVRIQQAINALNSLMDFVEVVLIEGKSAIEELKENP